jgi:hypothetical protein
MDQTNCTGCGKPLYEGDWVSKSGLCRACAEERQRAKDKVKFKKYWWAYLIGAIIFLDLVAMAVFKSIPTPPVVIFTDDGELSLDAQYAAISIVEDAVRDMLKAPDTAVFDHSEDFYIIDDDKSVTFSGEVTAQNSFGVPLRNTYIVIFNIWGLGNDENEVLDVMIE